MSGVLEAVKVVSAGEVSERRPWRTEGHPFLGQMARRFYDMGKGKEIRLKHYDGKIDGWLPPEGDDAPLWHLALDNGEDEELDEDEATEAVRDLAEGRETASPEAEAAAVKAAEDEAKAAAAEDRRPKSEKRIWASRECRDRWQIIQDLDEHSGWLQTSASRAVSHAAAAASVARANREAAASAVAACDGSDD